MKAKEKAEELVRKYYTFGINKEGQTLSWNECKQCALVAVDEVLNEENHFIQTDAHFLYWNQVKQEIEML